MATFLLGKPPHLPDYIKNNRHIIGLEKDKNNAYKDTFCFFHCLAVEKFGKTYHNYNHKAKELFDEYCDHFHIIHHQFQGVELDEIPELKKYEQSLPCF